MKILIIAHGKGMGGAQISTLEFIKILRDDIEIIMLTDKQANTKFLHELKDMGIRTYTEKFPKISSSLKTELTKQQPDVIWVSDQAYLMGYKVKKLLNKPLVYHLRDYSLVCPRYISYFGKGDTCYYHCSIDKILKCRKNFLYEYTNIKKSNVNPLFSLGWTYKGISDYLTWKVVSSKTVKIADGFIAVSHAARKLYLLHDKRFQQKKIGVVYNPTTLPRKIVQYSVSNHTPSSSIIYVLPHRREVILGKSFFQASNEIIKGAYILLNALRILKEEHNLTLPIKIVNPSTNLVIYAKKLGVSSMVHTYKFLPHEKLLKLISESAICTMPSLWPEPFGRVALEANLLGVPVIASNIGGLPEIVINRHTGVLSNPGDPSDLADKIAYAINKHWNRHKIHSITEKRFNNRIIKRQFIAYLEELM